MLVGNCFASNTEFSPMDKCPQTRQSEAEMMHSTLSFLKQVQESTSQEVSSLIFNQVLSIKLELEHTDNFSIQSNSSQEKKMPQATSPEDITQLVRKSLILHLIESENLLTTAQVFKDS